MGGSLAREVLPLAGRDGPGATGGAAVGSRRGTRALGGDLWARVFLFLVIFTLRCLINRARHGAQYFALRDVLGVLLQFWQGLIIETSRNIRN